MEKVKILGISGTHRKNKTTDRMLMECLDSAKMLGPWVETEFVRVMDYNIKPCIGCFACYTRLDPSGDFYYCSVKDDMPILLKKLLWADGIITASPVYWGGMTGRLKTFIDRTVGFCHGASTKYRGAMGEKVAGAITISWDVHGGLEATIDDIHHWYLAEDMIVVGAGHHHPHGAYFGGMVGKQPHSDEEGFKHDTFGMRSVRGLGKRVAEMALLHREGRELLKKLKEVQVIVEKEKDGGIEIDWDKYFQVQKHFPTIHIGVPGKIASSKKAIEKYIEWNTQKKDEKRGEVFGETVGKMITEDDFKKWMLKDIGMILISDEELYRHDPEYFKEYLKSKV